MGGAGVDQGLLLRQIQTRGESKIMPRRDEPQGIALQVQAMAHHREFGVEFAQGEVIRHELRRQQETGVFEIRFGLLRRSSRSLDLAAHSAEEVGFVIDGGTEFEIILHDRLVRHRIRGERAIRRCSAARRGSGQAHGGK